MTVSNLASLCKSYFAEMLECGAVDGTRTRNPRNGSPMLYQLNYYGIKRGALRVRESSILNYSTFFQPAGNCSGFQTLAS